MSEGEYMRDFVGHFRGWGGRGLLRGCGRVFLPNQRPGLLSWSLSERPTVDQEPFQKLFCDTKDVMQEQWKSIL